MFVFVLSVLLALSVSFFCSLLEATLLSLTPAPVAEITAKLGFLLGDTHGSVSAWLIRWLGRPPQPGDSYNEAETAFIVQRIRCGKILDTSVIRQRNAAM